MDILNELRLDSERTQRIMNEMGVEPYIDLKVLHYKDFISPGLTPQIVKMRYLAYVDQIVETAHEILSRRDELISGLKTEKNRRKDKYIRETPIGYIHPSRCLWNFITSSLGSTSYFGYRVKKRY